MIRPIQEIHTKVARIIMDKTLEDITSKGGVLLWDLEGRWGIVPNAVLENTFSMWRDWSKLRSLSPSTPYREFWIGWTQAMAVPPEAAKALVMPSVAVAPPSGSRPPQ